MKIPYLILLFLAFLTVACDQPNTDPNPTPNPAASNNPETGLTNINDYNATPKGTLTNEATHTINTDEISTGIQIPPEELLASIRQCIIPEYKNWLILKNGTYIIFDNIDTIPDVKQTAVQWLKHYQPKTAAEYNWDINVTDLDKIEGWSVFGNGYGIYTLVLAKELKVVPSPQQIGAVAKAKRALDENDPQIIYVSSEAGIEQQY